MRNLLALLGLVLVLFFGIGYVRGWYTFNWTTGSDGKTNFNLGVDRTRVGGDISDGLETAKDKIEQLKAPKTDAAVQPAGGTPPAVVSLPAPTSPR